MTPDIKALEDSHRELMELVDLATINMPFCPSQECGCFICRADRALANARKLTGDGT